MPSTQRDELGESVYQLLVEIDQVLITDLIADLCALDGWSTRVRMDDSSQYAEIIATRRLPYPESVRIMVSISTQFSKRDVDRATSNEADDGSLSTIVVKSKPSDEALAAARERGISVIGIGDVTEEILSRGTIDLVINYASDIQRIVNNYDEELSLLESWSGKTNSQESSDSEMDNDTHDSQTLPRTRPEAESNRLSVGLVGYDLYSPSSTTNGVFIAVKLQAKESLQLSAEDFALGFTDGTQRSAAGEADSSSLSKIAGVLEPEWTLGSLSLSEGETAKYVLYVPRSNDTESPNAIFVDNLQVPLTAPVSSQTYRGLPGPMVGVMNELLGDEFKKGHQESYVSYGVDEDSNTEQKELAQSNVGVDSIPLEDGFPAYQESKSYLTLSGDGPGTIGKYLSAEFLGHRYLSHLGEPGMLLAVTVGARALDIDIRPDKFTLHSEDDIAYQGASDVPIINQVKGSLTPSWSAGNEEVSAGGKRTFVLFFPAEEEFVPKKLRYRSAYNRLFTMSTSQVESQTAEGRYDEATIEVELTSTSSDRAQEIFEGKSAILDSILAVQTSDTADGDIYRSVLSAEMVGSEHNLFATEVTAWDFYRGQDNEENPDGLFIAVDVTGKHADQRFEHENFRLIDHDGYMHEGGRSTVLKRISSNGLLPSPWAIPKYGDIDVPADSTIKTLIHIPCTEPLTPEQIQLRGGVIAATDDVHVDAWTELRGLSAPVDEVLCSMGYN